MTAATYPISFGYLCVSMSRSLLWVLCGCAALFTDSALATELLEPPMPFPEGGAGDAATNQGHALSADGRFVVFTSYAANLIATDTNGARDVFVWDSQLNTVELVSRNNSGVQANGDSTDAVISADGQWVAFSSTASNLTADANGAVADIFLYSRASATIELLSKSTEGVQSQLASERPDINADGRYVTFDTAGNLVGGSGTTHSQVFRRDNWNNRTELISQSLSGAAANDVSMDAQMSADGERIVFISMATNLTSVATVGKESFLRDMTANSLQLLSLNAAGEAGNGISYFPTISGDGKFAAFHTNASNLVSDGNPNATDVVVREISSGALELLSRDPSGLPANDLSFLASLSYNGMRAVFSTIATNLVPGDAPEHVDIVLVDRTTSSLSLLSQGPGAEPANGDSLAASISLDGRSATFETRASNLSPNGSAFTDALLSRLDDGGTAQAPVVAAILPSSRSVELGQSFTAFASVLSPSMANDCRVQVNAASTIASGVLSFQATDPLTNASVGVPNQPFLLLPDVPQSLVLTLTPEVATSAEEVTFDFVCAEGTAPIVPGTNTLLVSAEPTAPADVVALAATLQNDGIVSLPQGGGAGFFSVASVNLGAPAEMVVQPVVLGAPLDGFSICQTNPATGVCLADASLSVSVSLDTGDTPTFAVFVSNSTDVPFVPEVNRVVLQFVDGSGIVRGRTSVAIASR